MKTSDSILITGATGMIGSALVRNLQKAGYSKLLTPTHATLELRDANAVSDYFTQHKPQFVFHLAARVGGIHANATYPAQFIYDNTQMQSNIFEAARKSGVQKLLFPGSACTYPKMAPQPVKEAEFMNGPIEPTNLAYATAKINGLVMAQSYAKEYGMKVVLPMPTNTYGVGDNFDPNASHVIPALMKRFDEARIKGTPEVVIWGTGTVQREFIYVDDVADAFLFLMQNRDDSAIVNVGTMQEVTINELAHKIAQVVDYKGQIKFDTSKPDGTPRKILDSTPLFAIGWKPHIGLAEGLKTMYKQHFKQESNAA